MHEGLRLFGFCVVLWEDRRKPSIKRCIGTKIGMVEIFFKGTETLTRSMESRRNSSGTSSQDLIRCSSATKSKVYCTDWEKHQKILLRKNSMYVDVQRHFFLNKKTMKKNVWQTLDSCLCMKENLAKDNQWSFIGPGCEKK